MELKKPGAEAGTPRTIDPKRADVGLEAFSTVGPKEVDSGPTTSGMVEHPATDPQTVFGLIYRAIEDGKKLVRLCVLLVVVAGVTMGMALLTPPDFLPAVLSLFTRGRS